MEMPIIGEKMQRQPVISITETIEIENFCGIQNMAMKFGEVNFLLGQQASGKSIILKLLYFFKTIGGEIQNAIAQSETMEEFRRSQNERFKRYFPPEAWGSGKMSIIYSTSVGLRISIRKMLSKNVIITYPTSMGSLFISKEETASGFNDEFDVMWNRRNDASPKVKEAGFSDADADIVFIPAGRAFYSNLQENAFTFLAGNDALDPFLRHFGARYERTRARIHFRQVSGQDNGSVSRLLEGRFVRKNKKEYLAMSGQREVPVLSASSGQQELLPLLLFLENLQIFSNSEMRRAIFVEEPESHLFPKTQGDLAKFLIQVFNNKKRNAHRQIYITTHSPYFLTEINNLILAGKLYRKKLSKIKKEMLQKLVPKEFTIAPGVSSAYFLEGGSCSDMIDGESGMIDGELLDRVSEENGKEFDTLLSLM